MSVTSKEISEEIMLEEMPRYAKQGSERDNQNLLYDAHKEDFDRIAAVIKADTFITVRDVDNFNTELLSCVEREHGLDLLGLAARFALETADLNIPTLLGLYRDRKVTTFALAPLLEKPEEAIATYLEISNSARNWPASVALLKFGCDAVTLRFERQKNTTVVSMCSDYPNCNAFRQGLLPLRVNATFSELTQVSSFQAVAIPFLLANSVPDAMSKKFSKIVDSFPAAFVERAYDPNNPAQGIIKRVQCAALAFYYECTAKRLRFPSQEYSEVDNLLSSLFEKNNDIIEEEVIRALQPFFTPERNLKQDTFKCQLMLSLLENEAFCQICKVNTEAVKAKLTPATQYEAFILPFLPVDPKEFRLE